MATYALENKAAKLASALDPRPHHKDIGDRRVGDPTRDAHQLKASNVSLADSRLRNYVNAANTYQDLLPLST